MVWREFRLKPELLASLAAQGWETYSAVFVDRNGYELVNGLKALGYTVLTGHGCHEGVPDRILLWCDGKPDPVGDFKRVASGLGLEYVIGEALIQQ